MGRRARLHRCDKLVYRFWAAAQTRDRQRDRYGVVVERAHFQDACFRRSRHCRFGACRGGRARRLQVTDALFDQRDADAGLRDRPAAIDQVPVGSSREQVLLALGTPSTTATFDNEVFYYISQTRVAPRRLPEPEAGRPAGARRLFRRRQPCHPDRQLRQAGRQDVRFHLAHHADRRQGPQLPQPTVVRRRRSIPSNILAGGGGTPAPIRPEGRALERGSMLQR